MMNEERGMKDGVWIVHRQSLQLPRLPSERPPLLRRRPESTNHLRCSPDSGVRRNDES
jgi:hypothetical protein